MVAPAAAGDRQYAGGCGERDDCEGCVHETPKLARGGRGASPVVYSLPKGWVDYWHAINLQITYLRRPRARVSVAKSKHNDAVPGSGIEADSTAEGPGPVFPKRTFQ